MRLIRWLARLLFAISLTFGAIVGLIQALLSTATALVFLLVLVGVVSWRTVGIVFVGLLAAGVVSLVLHWVAGLSSVAGGIDAEDRARPPAPFGTIPGIDDPVAFASDDERQLFELRKRWRDETSDAEKADIGRQIQAIRRRISDRRA